VFVPTGGSAGHDPGRRAGGDHEVIEGQPIIKLTPKRVFAKGDILHRGDIPLDWAELEREARSAAARMAS
jgi:hypothetical protein